MKTFKEYCLTEHPNLRARIIAKINPMSPINKKVTMMRKDKISDLVDKKRDLTDKAKGIGAKITSLRAKTK